MHAIFAVIALAGLIWWLFGEMAARIFVGFCLALPIVFVVGMLYVVHRDNADYAANRMPPCAKIASAAPIAGDCR
jgi:hypothetical protein